MKTLSMKRLKVVVLSVLLFLATFFGIAMWKMDTKTASASVTLNPDTYKTAGGSVRLFDEDGNVRDQRKGIRFHILMEKSLYETYSANANFVSYTVVLPKGILGTAKLGYDTPKAMKINTTEYWQEYADDTSFMESIAYVYDLPATKHATDLCFMGVFSTDGGSTWNETDVGVKSMAYVAKAARDDANATWNTTQEAALEYYIPKYEYTYVVGNTKTTETVEYGDELNIPTLAQDASWWYEEGNGEVAAPTTATFENLGGAGTTAIQLTSTTTSSFVLTGVEYTANGFNVFATLSAEKFTNGTTLSPDNVDMVKGDGTVVSATAVSVKVAGTGNNAKSELVISFNYDQISNGDTLTILKSSQFYYSGSLYELASDYTFEYNNSAWELPLGEIQMGDIENIVNWTEGSDASKEYNIRVNLRSDFLINGNATLQKADGCTKESSVYVTRTNGDVDYITSGYYYWNQGANKILELPQTNDLWGEDDGDVLTIEAGTKLVQNNGYYVFSDTITATFNGGVDWVFSYTTHEIDASEFVSAATRTETDQSGNQLIYIDVNTATSWADKAVKIVFNNGQLTYHNTDNVTTLNPDEVFYHGETTEGTKHSLLRIHLDQMSVTGDWVTIPEGSEFWVGDQIYVLTEDVISYYVLDSQSGIGKWITNPTFNEITIADISSMRFHTDDSGATYSIRYTTVASWSDYGNNRVVVDDTFIDGSGVVCSGTNYSRFFYYGAGNNLLEIQNVDFGSAGGSVTIKAGTILWLLHNSDLSFKGVYRVAEDLTITIDGANGSPIYKDVPLKSIYKSDIVHFYNDGSHGSEVRFVLNETKVTGVYGYADIDGSVTLNGKPTTRAFIYGGDGTSGYNGGTIVAFTGDGFEGGAFQGTARGDKIVVAAGTKLYLENGTGYILIEDEWCYVYDGATYRDGDNTYTVNFNVSNAAVTVDNDSVSSVAVETGDRVTFTFEILNGASLIAVNGATPNGDGSYTTDYIFENTTVTIAAAKLMGFDANCASGIQVYSEGSHTGVRINLDESKNALLSEIATNGYYDMTMTGTTMVTVGGVSTNFSSDQPYNFFGGDHGSLLELRFPTDGLQAGDTFTIKAGTVFSHVNLPYQLKFTEDFVGFWTGSAWMANPTKLGELNWSTLSRVISFSDLDGSGNPSNYAIRAYLTEELFDGVFSVMTASGNVTLNGAAYTGSWYYYGDGNKIIGLTQWNYKAGDVLVIEAGTKLFVGTEYYEVTETLYAKCSADGNGATWNWMRSSAQELGKIDWSNCGSVYSYSDFENGSAINYTIRMNFSNTFFNDVQCNGTIFTVEGNVTLNGAAYTGAWTYHSGAKILQINTWNYKADDILVIEAGTKICTSTGYYLVTKTLTATCSANGSGSAWNFTVS